MILPYNTEKNCCIFNMKTDLCDFVCFMIAITSRAQFKITKNIHINNCCQQLLMSINTQITSYDVD